MSLPFAVHISDGVLTAPWLAGGFALTALLALVGSIRVRDEEIPRIALLTAAFFVASSLHVRVGPTTLHLLLNGLVGVILGCARRSCDPGGIIPSGGADPTRRFALSRRQFVCDDAAGTAGRGSIPPLSRGRVASVARRADAGDGRVYFRLDAEPRVCGRRPLDQSPERVDEPAAQRCDGARYPSRNFGGSVRAEPDRGLGSAPDGRYDRILPRFPRRQRSGRDHGRSERNRPAVRRPRRMAPDCAVRLRGASAVGRD